MPAIVFILKFLETGHIIRQHSSIAQHQAFVVCGLPNGIDHIVEDSVIPSALIKIGLHLCQLLFRLIETSALSVACPDRAPDMIQIGPHVHENVRLPILAAKTLVAIVIPVLGNGTQRQRCDDYTCLKGSHHILIPLGTIIAKENPAAKGPLEGTQLGVSPHSSTDVYWPVETIDSN